MQIKFMKDDVVDTLKDEINKKNYLDCYMANNSSWINNVTNTIDNYGIFKHEFDDFDLIISDKPEKDDMENMKIIYTNLKGLSDSQAGDERLWAGLCHDKFWNYMQKRWPISSDLSNDDKSKFILQHYFFRHGARSVVTNGLARLWWYARLTYDEDNANNPFELTEYLAKDINGKGYMLFGSNFSSNRKLTKVFLYTIKNFEENNNIVLERNTEFGELRKKMVLWSGKLLIDYLSEEDIKNKLLKELNLFLKKRNETD